MYPRNRSGPADTRIGRFRTADCLRKPGHTGRSVPSSRTSRNKTRRTRSGRPRTLSRTPRPCTWRWRRTRCRRPRNARDRTRRRRTRRYNRPGRPSGMCTYPTRTWRRPCRTRRTLRSCGCRFARRRRIVGSRSGPYRRRPRRDPASRPGWGSSSRRTVPRPERPTTNSARVRSTRIRRSHNCSGRWRNRQ